METNTNYYQTKESVDEYVKLAADANGSQLIKKLKPYLPVDSQILEIGSGPGTDFQLLKKNYQVLGSDYSTEFLKRLIRNNPEDEFLNLDAVTLQTDRKFDGIYSNKVLHHLTNQELHKSLRRQANLLNDDGIVCHSFWRGEGDEIFKGLFVNYQTRDSLNALFEDHFNILLLQEYQEFEEGDSLVLIGKKK